MHDGKVLYDEDEKDNPLQGVNVKIQLIVYIDF